jgi:hypothetical protein
MSYLPLNKINDRASQANEYEGQNAHLFRRKYFFQISVCRHFFLVFEACVWGIYCKIIRAVSQKNVATWVNKAHLRITKK